MDMWEVILVVLWDLWKDTLDLLLKLWKAIGIWEAVGLVVTFFSCLIVYSLIWRYRRIQYFKKLNIPGPKPSIIFGNIREIVNRTPIVCHKEWIAKYGKVYGYFYGMRPVLMVADVELLRQIQQSDSKDFIDRPGLYNLGNALMHSLVNLEGDTWRRVRSMVTPSFTTRKLKQVTPIIHMAIGEMMDCLDKVANTGVTFNVYKYYQRLTMDVIGRAAFGIETNVQKTEEEDTFLETAKTFLSVRLGKFTIWAFSFPGFEWLFVLARRLFLWKGRFMRLPEEHLGMLSALILKERRENPGNRRADILQLMIEAERTEIQVQNVANRDLIIDDEQDREAEPREEPQVIRKMVKMTDQQITENSILFFLAGYETTSTTLGYMTHFLVNNPSIQDRVRSEISERLAMGGDLDYDLLKDLRYLDQVVKETLRKYPPIYLFVNRKAANDKNYHSVFIKKGMAVQIPVYHMHHDPELWEDPDVFNPDRFDPAVADQINKHAWQPFGYGPRNCIGMRFAQMEAKVAIARVLLKYKILPGPETERDPLTISFSDAALQPTNGVWVKLENL